ncbi:MAG: LysM peptidoglycan-binding domain-containing protein [Flavobacteriaceae bacterium]|nr:LysM peptidoglycan-binding domain-containing protein [Flavobacteriaceae bacterium]
MKNIKILILLLFTGIFSIIAQQKKFVTYKVSEGETIQSISKKLSITPFDLLKLNPDVDKDLSVNDILIVPNKDFEPGNEIVKIDLSMISAKDIIVDNYIYHEVSKKETLYSLLKKYNTNIDDLNKANPFLNGNLKYGEVIKIPLQKIDEEIVDSATKLYIVKPKETKYSIARTNGISIAYLEELNPKLKETGLQSEDIILIPKERIIASSDLQIHKIEKSETLFSLSNLYGISQEELLVANPQLANGVNEGMLIEIPQKEIEKTEIFNDKILDGSEVNIALMLPFNSKRDSLDFKNDRLLNITTDFYLGSLIAIDSLGKQGLSVNLKVYDTENSEFVSKKLSQNSEFNKYDVVIGPMFLKNVKAVSNNLKNSGTLILSPLSSKDHISINNHNLVQEIPTDSQMALEMLQYVKANYKGQKLILISDENNESGVNYNNMINEIKSIDTLQNMTLIKPKKGYIKLDVFKKSIDTEKENWILLLGDNELFVKDVIHNLGVLPEENNITLFAFKKGKNYDNIDNNYLNRVNFHYPTSNYFNGELESCKAFNSIYRNKYNTYPSKYSMMGFDMTYDILMRLATSKDIVQQGVSQRLLTKFNYIENTSNSILNNGIYIVKYEDLELKKLN